MTVKVDVWLRGSDFATTRSISGIDREPKAWTDRDVSRLLHGMLETMHELKHPDEENHSVSLRGLSWIVNPYEDGGVVVAIEIGMGAAVAGPFDIDEKPLSAMISRVMAPPVAASTATTIH